MRLVLNGIDNGLRFNIGMDEDQGGMLYILSNCCLRKVVRDRSSISGDLFCEGCGITLEDVASGFNTKASVVINHVDSLSRWATGWLGVKAVVEVEK